MLNKNCESPGIIKQKVACSHFPPDVGTVGISMESIYQLSLWRHVLTISSEKSPNFSLRDESPHFYYFLA